MIPKGLTKWQRIAWQFFNASSAMSNFYRYLCAAIQFADPENTARLRKAFPELVAEIKGETVEVTR